MRLARTIAPKGGFLKGGDQNRHLPARRAPKASPPIGVSGTHPLGTGLAGYCAGGGPMVGMNWKEMAMLGAGIFILYDRGVSWMFMAGVALLAVGANRLMRGL